MNNPNLQQEQPQMQSRDFLSDFKSWFNKIAPMTK